ncbi:hypothetical protein [Streptomyces sp. NPDC059957]|uniref:hypothetical protein n=1 Tax=unclassified Streptomyces TaxID=2593676 RepID=UPI00365C25E3
MNRSKHSNHPPDLNDEQELGRLLRELSATQRWAEGLVAEEQSAPEHVEEPLEGPRFTVETRTEGGMHTVVGIAAGEPPTEAQQSLLRSAVRALLDLAGHEAGTAHTAVVLTDRGPRIVECRVPRQS